MEPASAKLNALFAVKIKLIRLFMHAATCACAMNVH